MRRVTELGGFIGAGMAGAAYDVQQRIPRQAREQALGFVLPAMRRRARRRRFDRRTR